MRVYQLVGISNTAALSASGVRAYHSQSAYAQTARIAVHARDKLQSSVIGIPLRMFKIDLRKSARSVVHVARYSSWSGKSTPRGNLIGRRDASVARSYSDWPRPTLKLALTTSLADNLHVQHSRAWISTMAEQKSVVYLEDLETPTSSQATEAAGDKPAKVVASKTTTKVTKSASNDAKNSKVSTKRQASLMDMFSGAGAKSIAKRRKIEKSSVSTTEETASPPATLAPPKPGQTLNSIPFSLSAYVESLSEDQRRLLALECDTMGKSW